MIVNSLFSSKRFGAIPLCSGVSHDSQENADPRSPKVAAVRHYVLREFIAGTEATGSHVMRREAIQESAGIERHHEVQASAEFDISAGR